MPETYYVIPSEAIEEYAEKLSWWIETNRGSILQSDCPRREGWKDRALEVFFMMIASGEIYKVEEVKDG